MLPPVEKCFQTIPGHWINNSDKRYYIIYWKTIHML